MRMTRSLWLSVAVVLPALLAGCDDKKTAAEDGGIPTANLLSLFEPAPSNPASSAVVPFPFDGLFNGFSDPTLNIPNPTGVPFVTAANLTDGFSTTAAAFTDLIGFVDFASANQALLVIDTSTGAPLVPGVDYVLADYPARDNASGIPINVLRTRIMIHWLRPLKGSTRYLVALTDALRDTSGNTVLPSAQFRLVRSGTPVADQDDPYVTGLTPTQRATLEALRSQLIRPAVEALLGAVPALDEEDLILVWTFTTQSIGRTIQRIEDTATARPIGAVFTGLTTGDINPALPPVADVYFGSFSVPYFLPDAGGNPQSTAPLSGFFQADPAQPDLAARFLGQVPCGAFASGAPLPGGPGQPSVSTTICYPVPVQQSSQTVPMLVTVPNANSGRTRPAAGWPVVIFQHGVVVDRSTMLGIAPALAAGGFVAVAIDLPLHGLPAGHPLRVPGTTERHFELDLVNNTTRAPGPDGVVDSTGTHFINLSSLITSRDNLRQASSDLIHLIKSVPNLNLDGNAGTVDINPDRIHMIAWSAGGIVGTSVLAVNDEVGASALITTGGGVAKVLDASKSFGPVIAAGLAGNGIAEGTDNYESFVRFAQHLTDDGDSANYAAAASANHPLYANEVIGDLVLPNEAPRNPGTATLDRVTVEGLLSGTEPFLALIGAEVIGPIDPPLAPPPDVHLDPNGLRIAVVFAEGTHGSIVTPAGPNGPTEFLAVTAEMQRQTVNFLASEGRCLPIGGNCP